MAEVRQLSTEQIRGVIPAAYVTRAEFDLWLAAYAAAVLRSAADAWTQGAWADTPRHTDRIADRMGASQYAGDWLRARADAITA